MKARPVASLLIGGLLIGAVLLAGCAARPSDAPATAPPTPRSGPSTIATPTNTGSTGSPTPGEIPEPTTTNTLPPPPRPSRAAPSTAGDLDADSLPVPKGWRTAAREGGEEEGYLGNGTWVHARDPRYAAFDAITIGCAPVTRDDYTDPTSALEGTYDRHGEPGIGLVLAFADAAAARAYFDLYQAQVDACRHADAGVVVSRVPDRGGLIDRRTYPDGDWTEVGAVVGRRVTLIILSDPGHRITTGASQDLLSAIR